VAGALKAEAEAGGAVKGAEAGVKGAGKAANGAGGAAKRGERGC